ncbi:MULTISPECIES: type III secretion system gatekeeper subunit SctW [Pseudomonas]|uniref:type III secretion system gatekeeper subunit SctW n=1 Tax=Pseudomonas TaxID=286 RepID=UPI000F713051|nr:MULTISPECIES: type III secretion system gatekeeper subunit SctW [Pseudomonas]AZF15576.1 hypothetical protein C4J92_2092 [Pseudomonas sp. R3-18-08]AZF26222.1 hypothetical protein C4J90_2049 [Pseudomonas sp. R2-60-08W]AZF31587.1 hypothetical protein C4J89_2112 [Pseudomonas sp. R4-35-07]AZF36862.1 hypothetical protein C4J88_2079 [Pseudomonas sp. R4-39-08]AZF52529.1 hypothetical protein C4J85_2044 [Pseudomonas sp. R4-34-07]
MVTSIPSAGRSPQHQQQLHIKRESREAKAQQSQAAAENGADSQIEDTSPGAQLQKFMQSVDELSTGMRSLLNRRRFESKGESLSDSFERVLEEDLLPRVQQILSIAKSGGQSLELLLQKARSLFADDSDLALVLSELLRRRNLDKAQRKQLEQMLETLVVQAPPKRLRAGINCALKAKLFGKAMALKPGFLRQSYREFLENEHGPVLDYENWIALYGYTQRTVVLDFIEAALLTDIDAQEPSCSKTEFGELLKKLNQLKCLRSADLLFVGRMLGDEITRRYNGCESDWLLFLIGLLQAPEELDELLYGVLGEAVILAEPHQRAALLGAVRRGCSLLPPALYEDDEIPGLLQERFEVLMSIAFETEVLARRRCCPDSL